MNILSWTHQRTEVTGQTTPPNLDRRAIPEGTDSQGPGAEAAGATTWKQHVISDLMSCHGLCDIE